MPPSSSTPLRRAVSALVGRLSEARMPTPLRPLAYRVWALCTRSDLSEVRLPLRRHPTFGDFFVRRLRDGVRPCATGPNEVVSPVDGTVQSVDAIAAGTILQAKGRPYLVRDLLGDEAAARELEGGTALTIYLAPRDYHRIHAPQDALLTEVRHLDGARYSVRPSVLAARPVLDRNERVALGLERDGIRAWLVLVGALNVGRIGVVGAPRGRDLREVRLAFRRGDELARFEMGSTVVLLWPRGACSPSAPPGARVRVGEAVGRVPSD